MKQWLVQTFQDMDEKAIASNGQQSSSVSKKLVHSTMKKKL